MASAKQGAGLQGRPGFPEPQALMGSRGALPDPSACGQRDASWLFPSPPDGGGWGMTVHFRQESPLIPS